MAATAATDGPQASNMTEDEGGGVRFEMCPPANNSQRHQQQQSRQHLDAAADDDAQHEQQPTEIFVKHANLQHQHHRRSSLPVDAIELPTLSGVVMRRKQQIQLRYQQLQLHQPQHSATRFLLPQAPNKIRPLSISSVSSAASSGSSSSANSSASSGIQSSLTRNGSLNYGHEFRKCTHLASAESLNSGNQHQPGNTSNHEHSVVEKALKNLSLSGQFKDAAAARAAVIAAGAQSRGFSTASRINRSLHASLRYDKNTAYRIHMMANARALQASAGNDTEDAMRPARTPYISRNNSSTSSDSGHHTILSVHSRSSRFACQCGSNPSLASSSSASQVDQTDPVNKRTAADLANKAASLDSASSKRGLFPHHPDCHYSKRPRKASSKLQPSPSSASSHSNTSSLFRDDGFEDDLNSTASEQASSHYQHHHRLSFQGRAQIHRSNHECHSIRPGDDDDEYQSCEEEFANSHTTASTASNLDDCALSTTSSSIMHYEQQVIDKIALANAKQQYRKSLLLEHQQQQHLIQSQLLSQSKIQSLLTTSPKICHINALSSNPSANTSNTSGNAGCSSPIKQAKCDDRTVNIIGHMPTKSPGYWDSNLSITQRVVTEIIETERTYVDDLEQIVTGYICYLRNVLKQQKQQQSQVNEEDKKQKQAISLIDSSRMVKTNTDEDSKSVVMVFDDDITSATNDIEDDDVEEADNDIVIKENNSHIVKDANCSNFVGATLTATHIKKLFNNLEDIYKFNKDLLFRLEECYLNPSSVAECFVENASGFEVYTHYCTMYPQVVSTLTELMNNQTAAQLLKERQQELNQSLPLGSYLLKPVQRILKYHILFQSLIKHTTDDESVNEKDRQLIDEAFSVMTNIACHINGMKKRHEHAIRVQEVQGLLSGWEGPDLTALGELILEDTFKLYNRPKSTRHLFLFDNVLLITKKKRDGTLCYKGHIACSNLMLIENIEGQPLVFNTVPFDNPKALCAFQAKNLDKKRDWCLQMKEVIIKSFEIKIPVHVRDILMSLTNISNTTEMSPKSDATKAIKAPNYLEKKRIKQEKKR